ncbi:MAG: phospholipase D-like domain-containing protein [Bacteroidota bacterium]
MEKFAKKNGVSVRAYKGDAMTLLAFDLETSLKNNLAGFTIKYSYKKGNKTESYYIFNRLVFPEAFLQANPDIPAKGKNSTLYSPIQKFNWVHVPNTDINTQEPIFGEYTYEITPRYIENKTLLELDKELTVKVKIDVSPYNINKTEIGFTRGFVSSTAYAKRFNVKNNKVRPNETELVFDITQIADTASRWNNDLEAYEDVDYSFEEHHRWLGWQARQRIMDFLKETLEDDSLYLKVFAYDLNEPEICNYLLQIAEQNRLKIILDNEGKHGGDNSFENLFEKEFKKVANDNNDIQRGKFGALAHSKVFIQTKNNKAIKVLTGATNFSTNGLYINSNHVLIFNNKKVAQLYSEVFDASFGKENMTAFKGTNYSTDDFEFSGTGAPDMTITFAPHTKEAAQRIFDRINARILKKDNTDVLFAIMKDTNASSILDSVKTQVENGKIFTYGITDSIGKDAEYKVYLYKPNSTNGIRIKAKGIENILPEPFGEVAKIDGYAIHHKFVVVNFKGKDPVVYCGSSNLSFNPEQKNGDNLLEIHDKDIVTAFAIEALRLVDHFHWRNNEIADKKMYLDALSKKTTAWYLPWFNAKDLRCQQRKLYIRE